MIVKFFDYPKLYSEHSKDYESILKKTLSKGSYILQNELVKFEENLKKYLDAQDVVGVADGTNALILSLIALDISHGDEVLLPSHTYIATASAVKFVGAKPILCECNEDSSISVDDLKKKVNSKTKLIIPVNLNGKCCDLDMILQLRKKFKGLKILEDSAQGLGSRLNDKHAGTFGELGTISFYPAKTLGCFGDGGAIIVNEKKYIKKIRMLRDHGRNTKGSVEIWGTNSRLDNIQAAILDFKLKNLGNYIKKRQQIAKIYDQLDILKEVTIPQKNNDRYFNSYQNYECLFKNRNKLKKYLTKKGIGTMIQWNGKALHQFDKLDLKHFSLPRTDLFFKKSLMLPMNTFITNAQAKYVVKSIFEFYGL